MTSIVGIDLGGARAAAIHQNRLVLAGSVAIPDLVLASKSNDWTDFALTEDVSGEQVATPASGFWFEQVASRNNPFNAILQQEGLFLFGEQGESTVPAGPFTAAQTEIRENSWFGAEQGFQPLIAGGLAVFVQRGGTDLRGINWTEAQRKYEAVSLRETAGDIFTRIVDFTAKESADADPTTVFVVNEDGSIAVLVLRRSSPEIAWSLMRTQGRVKAAASSGDFVVFIVERGGVYGLETFGGAQEGEACLDAPQALVVDGELAVPSWMGESACFSVGHRLTPEALDLDRASFSVESFKALCEGGVISRGSSLDDMGGDVEDDPYVCIGNWSCQRLDASVRTVRRDRIGVVALDGAGVEVDRYDVPDDETVVIGSSFTCGIETLPFTVRSESGTKLAVLKSRIFGLVIVFGSKRPAEFYVNGRAKDMQNLRRARRGISLGEAGGSAVSGSNPTRVGSLSGWRRRATLVLEFDYHCFIRSVNYRASG